MPRVAIIGEKSSGKTNFIAYFTGVLPRESTICPVEWRLTPSDRWSAIVRLSSAVNPRNSRDLAHSEIGSQCSTPSQLRLLIKKAELVIFNRVTNISLEKIISCSEDQVNSKHDALVSGDVWSDRVIIIELCSPSISSSLTLIDLPGLINSGPEPTIRMLRAITQEWIDDPEFSIASIIDSSRPLGIDLSWHLIQDIKYIHKAIIVVSLRQTILPEWEALAVEETFTTLPVYFVQKFPQRDIRSAATMPELRRQQIVTMVGTHWHFPTSAKKLGPESIMRAWGALDTLRLFRCLTAGPEASTATVQIANAVREAVRSKDADITPAGTSSQPRLVRPSRYMDRFLAINAMQTISLLINVYLLCGGPKIWAIISLLIFVSCHRMGPVPLTLAFSVYFLVYYNFFSGEKDLSDDEWIAMFNDYYKDL